MTDLRTVRTVVYDDEYRVRVAETTAAYDSARDEVEAVVIAASHQNPIVGAVVAGLGDSDPMWAQVDSAPAAKEPTEYEAVAAAILAYEDSATSDADANDDANDDEHPQWAELRSDDDNEDTNR